MKNSTYLMIHRLIKSIAESIIKVFTPILIFQRTGNLTLCFIYFLANFAFTSLFFLLGRKIVQKIPVVSVIISIFLMMCGNLLLLLNLNIWSVLLIAFVEAVYVVMYYGSINLIFGLLDKNANTAKFEGGEYIGKIIFIILSAYILGEYQNSLPFVVIASVVMYSLSLIPLCIKFKDIHVQIKSLPNQPAKATFKDIKRFNIYHVTYGIINYFLPLFLFVKGFSFSNTGFLIALQNLGSLATGFLTNFTEQKKITKYFVITSALLMIPAFIVMMFVNNVVVCYIPTFILTVTSNFIFIALYRRYVLDQTNKNYFQHSVFYRDVFINMGRAFCPAVFLIVPFFPVIFGISVASSAAIMFSANSCLKQTNNLAYGISSPEENNKKAKNNIN